MTLAQSLALFTPEQAQHRFLQSGALHEMVSLIHIENWCRRVSPNMALSKAKGWLAVPARLAPGIGAGPSQGCDIGAAGAASQPLADLVAPINFHRRGRKNLSEGIGDTAWLLVAGEHGLSLLRIHAPATYRTSCT